ncbi:hypothetical protein [Micromonospora sp. RTGN7]|uniref:hypothetical protein n=1 Tax=Micromonospora sp. RTGN7 TaxID=3016526 RepID=UPI0029FF51C8|nr:hypothetical protein [Micromonospora sp. RTGN7]
MEIFTYARPAAMPAAVAPMSAVRAASVARPPAPWAHQVRVQAELNLTVEPLTGVEGAIGSTAMGVDGAKKRTDVRGVPPRGRPV